MLAIYPTLSPGQQGPEVTNLHEALRRLGFDHIPADEINEQRYGDITTEMVRLIQHEFGVPTEQIGLVDEPTAAAINRRLLEIGSLYLVEGTARALDGSPLVGNLAFAFDKENLGGAYLGYTNTNADGYFRIFYDPRRYAQPGEGVQVIKEIIDMLVQVYDTGGATLAESDIFHNPAPQLRIELQVHEQTPPEFRYLVRGQVVYRQGKVIPNALVRAFNKELRREDLLGETTTDASGNYEIYYSPDKFGRAKQYANLIVRAYEHVTQADGSVSEKLLGESPIKPNASTIEKIRLYIESEPAQKWSEFEQLQSEVEPLLGELPPHELTETRENPDISLLAGELGQEVSRVAAFTVAHKMAAKTNIAPEIYYGLLRQNQPSNLSGLLAQDPVTQRTALQQAVKRNLIPGRLQDQLDEVQAALRQQIVDYSVQGDSDAQSLRRLLGSTLTQPEELSALITTYLEHPADPSQFWQSIEANPALQEKVPQIRLDLQLAALTGKHPPLLQELQRMHSQGEFTSLRHLAGFGIEQWQEIVQRPEVAEEQLFPSGIPAQLKKEDKARVYAETLARIMEDALPAETLAHRITQDNHQPDHLRTFFNNVLEVAPEFDLLRTDVRQLVQAQPALLQGIEDTEVVIHGVQGMQRLYKFARIDEVRSLAQAGFDSSLAIANMDRTLFIKQFEPALGLGRARAIHASATQMTATVLNYFANFSPVFNHLPLAVLATPNSQAIPNLETLFGSLDFCACEHCRSVHGPAAYLAELLAYLGERQQAQGSAQDVLMARRPDLGEIELSCENTNTVLPYLDLVLEILENVVSPFKPFTLPDTATTDLDNETISAEIRAVFAAQQQPLSEDHQVIVLVKSSRWRLTDRRMSYLVEKFETPLELRVISATPQTFGTTAELNANPQHSNPAAYERLRQAVSAPNLPLDLWWEEANIYLGQLGLQRYELMRNFYRGSGEVLADLAIATEYLGLTPFERDLITGGQAVRVATTSDLADLTDPQTVDGVTLQPDDWVLVKDQVAATANGLYAVQNGPWTLLNLGEERDYLVSVNEGFSNGGSGWRFNRLNKAYTRLDEWELWGLTEQNNPVQVFDPNEPGEDKFVTKNLDWQTALHQVRSILHAGSLTYEELLDLLKTEYVNPGGLIRIESADPNDLTSCDTAKLVLSAALDRAGLRRLSQFVRLWRKLKWRACEVDRAISIFGLNESLVVKLAHAQQLSLDLGLDIQQALTFWTSLDTAGPGALYPRLFLNSAVLKPLDEAFKIKEGELAILANNPTEAKISRHLPPLMAGLSLSASDLALLLKRSDDTLNLANLSQLYRYTLLARGTNLSITEMLTLRDLAQLNPFDPAHTEDALYFVDLVKRIRAAGFTIAEMDYLLRHQASESTGLLPDNAALADFLTQLRQELRQIQDETRWRPDSAGDLTRRSLARLKLPDSLIEEVINTLAGQVVYEAFLDPLPAAELTIPAELKNKITLDKSAKKLRASGPLTSAEKQSLANLSHEPNYTQAVQTLFDAPRQFIISQLKAYAFPTFAADLSSLPGEIVFPTSLRGRIFYDAPAKQMRFTGLMLEAEKEALDQLSAEAGYRTAVQTLYDDGTAYTPAESNTFLTSTDAVAMFDQPTTPEERFGRLLTKLLVHLRELLSRGLVTQRLSEFLRLDTRLIESLAARLIHAAGSAEAAFTDFLVQDFAESDSGVVVTEAAFPAQFETLIRLQKVALLIGRLKLSHRQLRWLEMYGPKVTPWPVPWQHGALSAGWLDLNTMPVKPQTEGVQGLAGLLRLLALVDLRSRLSGGEATLDEIFALAHTEGVTIDHILTTVSQRTGWDKAELTYLTGPDGFKAALPSAFGDEWLLSRLRFCLHQAIQLATTTANCIAWSAPQLQLEEARAIRQTVKSQYDETGWNAIAKPLADALRQRRRDALVAYLLSQPGYTWQNTNELYAHLLIDVEMDPCMATSRLKQAISSVQLFVQRCRMNLEAPHGVIADESADPGWRQWKWMKNYRVWEANRKVFLYPENWLEPDLRDDKTPFFRELESTLMQGDVNQDTVEDAYIAYLEKLDAVGRLEIAGVYFETASGGKPDTVHVFGRSPSNPPVYYYRQQVGGVRWTAWERVELDIGDAPILPLIWNRRLYLFWVIFKVEAEEQAASDKPQNIKKFFTLQLAWSERKRGKWLAKKMIDETLKIRSKVGVSSDTDQGRSLHTFRAQIEGAGLKLWYEYDDPEERTTIQVDYRNTRTEVKYAEIEGWQFTGCNGQVQKFTRQIYGIYQPQGTLVSGMQFKEGARILIPIPTGGVGGFALIPLLLPLNSPLFLPKEGDALEDVALSITPGQFRLLYAHQDGKITGNRPFFYQDDTRTYYVIPEDVSITRWQGGWHNSLVDLFDLDRLNQYYYQPQSKPDRLGAKARLQVRDYLPVEQARQQLWREQQTLSLPAQPVAMAAAPALTPAVYSTRNNQFIIDKGERRLLPISDYVSDDRISIGRYIIPVTKQERRYTFFTHYHPYVCDFIKELNRVGVDGLFSRQLQDLTNRDFKNRYGPTELVQKGGLDEKYPIEEVDFSYSGAYAHYNWECFFHTPWLIAIKLMQNQRFEEAQRWFHYIFDPTDTSKNDAPAKFWRTRPFYTETRPEYLKQRIDKLLDMLAKGTTDPELDRQVAEWRENPFKPHLIARLRLTAYQKSVVMKYLDNLLAWGDQLFRQDTIESINEATQLYILAAEILGPRPQLLSPRAQPPIHTFNTLAPELQKFTNKLVDMELVLPSPSPDTVVVAGIDTPLPVPKVPYFCIPPNDKLLGYWDMVADRLFKIRHCMNIEGLVRQLPLFEPPLDPALLVRAAAAGVDLGSILNDANAPRPHYRFSVLAQKATELCAELKSLGNALLSALEKRDAEALALTRARHEVVLLDLVKLVKEEQYQEAQQNIVALRKARENGVARYLHYQKLLGNPNPAIPKEGGDIPDTPASANAAMQSTEGVKITQHEKSQLDSLGDSQDHQGSASDWSLVANILHALPTINLDVKPWGIGVGTGLFLGPPADAIANGWRAKSTRASTAASKSGLLSQSVLREHDWALQSNVAAKEIMHLDQQIVAAQIREGIAKRERDNHYQQQQQSAEIEEFLRSKYTNQELYDWLVGQVAGIYFQAYQMVYDLAKRTERAYRFELGLPDSTFIQFGYWDSLKKGLLAGERLYQDLKRMELAYIDQHKREHEMTKHVSLASLNPEALVSLRESGACFFDLPEAIFDLDHAGHYRRRLKSVSLTIPCIAGPYTSLNAKLTLLSNRYRAETRTQPAYAWQGVNDSRFVYASGGLESIVTSTGREDSGLFELNLHDERLLPFEGAGAISAWRLELPAKFRQFDYHTISDVIFHVRYTAADSGGPLNQAALEHLLEALKQMEVQQGKTGLFRLFGLRHDFTNNWQQLMFPAPAQVGEPATELGLTAQHFPLYAQEGQLHIDQLTVFVQLKKEVEYDPGDPLELTIRVPDNQPEQLLSLAQVETELGGLPFGSLSLGLPGVKVNDSNLWHVKATKIPANLVKTAQVNGQAVSRLDPDKITELGVLVHYTF